MTGQRPLTADVIAYALTLAETMREQDRALPDVAVCGLEELTTALLESGYRNGPVRDVSLWGGRHHLFGMRVIIDAEVPPGVIEFRPALRLPL